MCVCEGNPYLLDIKWIKGLLVPSTLKKLFRNSSSMWKYDPCKTAKISEACGDLMSKCWSCLEAPLVSEPNSSKKLKHLHRRECLSLAHWGYLLLVFFCFLGALFNIYIPLCVPVRFSKICTDVRSDGIGLHYITQETRQPTIVGSKPRRTQE